MKQRKAEAAPELKSTVVSTSTQEEYRYLVYRVGSTYNQGWRKRLIELEDMSFATLMQSCANFVSDSGGLIRILYDNADYAVDHTIFFDAHYTVKRIKHTW